MPLISLLAGRVEGRLKTVSLTLGAHILKNAGIAESVEAGFRMLEEKLNSGEGLKKLGEMFAAQGGDPRVVEDVSLLPRAKDRIEVPAPRSGYVRAIRNSDIGEAAKLLGAGRERKEDAIEPAVGIVMRKSIGDYVEAGEPVCTLHANPASDVDGARARISAATFCCISFNYLFP